MLYVPLAAMGLFSSKVFDAEWHGSSAAVKSDVGSVTEVSSTAKDVEHKTKISRV